MIIIGEKLNSSIPKTMKAYELCAEGNDEQIVELIVNMERSGSDYIDVNTALCNDEAAMMKKTVELVKSHSSCGIVIDSPDINVLVKCAEYADGRDIILNSVKYEELPAALPVLKKYGAGFVCMLDHSTLEERMSVAEKTVAFADDNGIAREKIFFDIATQSIATDSESAILSLNTIKALKERWSTVMTVCGLSNASFGLPKRVHVNAAYLTCAVWQGLDSAIMDSTSDAMQMALRSANVVAGKDEYCMDYISYIRENQ